MFAKSSKTGLVRVAVLFALLFFFKTPLLVGMGRWLVAETPVENVDLVVALGGHPSREDAAVKYLNQGLAQRILHIGSNHRAEGEHFVHIPDGKTLTVVDSAHTTYEEALRLRRTLNEHAFRSVLIVTSAYHLRCAQLAFERVFRDSGVHFMFAAVPKSEFPIECWWQSEAARKVVFREYLALGFYWLTVW